MNLSQHAKMLMGQLRELEVLLAVFDHDVIYEVYVTNADLEEVKLVYQGLDKDIALSVMFKAFVSSGCETDYMLYNRKGQDIVESLFSNGTLMKLA
jgi:hypothetical protein